MIARLVDPAVQRRLRPPRPDAMRLSHVEAPAWKWAEGSSVAAAAEQAGLDEAAFVCTILAESRLNVGVILDKGDFDEEDVRALTRHDAHMASSDGIFVGRYAHPRGWGSFARYLGRHVRELGDLSWVDAVRHLSTAAADRFGLADRGRLAPGAAADVAVVPPRRRRRPRHVRRAARRRRGHGARARERRPGAPGRRAHGRNAGPRPQAGHHVALPSARESHRCPAGRPRAVRRRVALRPVRTATARADLAPVPDRARSRAPLLLRRVSSATRSLAATADRSRSIASATATPTRPRSCCSSATGRRSSGSRTRVRRARSSRR